MSLELQIEIMKTEAFNKIYEEIKRENPLYWNNPQYQYIRDLALRRLGVNYYQEEKNDETKTRKDVRGTNSKV